MASSLTEALMSSITYGLNPENAAQAEFVRQTTAKLELEVNDLKLNQMGRVQKLIAEAREAKADASVIDAYDRMLVKLST